MTGRRIGAAASRGRGRTGLNKEATAGSKRKAQEVLCIEHNSGSTTPRQAAAQSQSQQTIKSVRLSFQQEASNFEAKIQEQSVAELAGLTAMEHDLKQSAKADYQDACKHLEEAQKLLDFVEGEWASDMQELETNCNSCVAAIRSQTAVLNRVQGVQESIAQQLTSLVAHNKVR